MRIEREQYRRDRELDRRIEAEDERIQRETPDQSGQAPQEETTTDREAPRDAVRGAGEEVRGEGPAQGIDARTHRTQTEQEEYQARMDRRSERLRQQANMPGTPLVAPSPAPDTEVANPRRSWPTRQMPKSLGRPKPQTQNQGQAAQYYNMPTPTSAPTVFGHAGG